MECVGQNNRDGKLYVLKIYFRVVSKQILHNLRKALGNLSSSWLVSGALFHPISYTPVHSEEALADLAKGILLRVFRVEDAQSERIIICEKMYR